MKYNINGLILILLLIMVACGIKNNSNISDQVENIKQKHIVDKRLTYWAIDVSEHGNEIEISGATVSEAAFNDLKILSETQGLGFSATLLPSDDFSSNPWGLVTLSVCNIRGADGHSAELVTQAVMGTPVKVYQKRGSWYLIQTPDRYFGWVDDAAIALISNSDLAKWKKLKKVLYKNQYGFAYAEADSEGAVEFDLALSALLSIIDEKDDYYKIVLADAREAYVKKNECVSLELWKSKETNAGEVLSTAYKFMGVPYLWGGTSSKMVDCSGFTKSAFYFHGILLQRDASQQTLYGNVVNTDDGYGSLQSGDLVFFGTPASDSQKEKVTHVGIYMGEQEFIHASGKVRINSLDPKSEKYTAYYESAFVRGCRIIDNIDGRGMEWVVENSFYKEILN